VRERGAIVNRIQKVLEDANIKLASVVTDILGVSGRAMLEHICKGEVDAKFWQAWLGADFGRSQRL
jgi:transposase